MKKLFAATVLFLLLIGAVLWYENGFISIPLPSYFTQLQSQIFHKPFASEAPEQKSLTISAKNETRAVWVATAYAIDYPSKPTTDASAMQERCTQILDKAVSDGLNTIYLQVRPAADAIYPSKYFPWSKYLTGECGTAPSDDFDPLAYWVEQAHARDLKIEAWINPYRICAGSQAQEDFNALPESSPAKQHADWVVQCDGGYYFDPSQEGVRQLICDGIEEIVSTYSVDGIQFDDYFYPSEKFDDADAYAAADTELSLADWRRENVNLLVEAAGKTVHNKARNMQCVFGISPSGIWRNKGVNSFGGSATKGYEHYTSSYADSMTWIQNNWIDYICPQVYWEIGNDAADFETLANWWANHLKGSKTKLILGLAAYKIGDSEQGSIWESDGCAEISRQLDLVRQTKNIDGYAVFSYQNLETTDGLSDLLAQKNNKD